MKMEKRRGAADKVCIMWEMKAGLTMHVLHTNCERNQEKLCLCVPAESQASGCISTSLSRLVRLLISIRRLPAEMSFLLLCGGVSAATDE